MPTLSQRPDRARATLAGSALAAWLLACSTPAHAHGEAALALPEAPGLRIGLTAAVAHIETPKLLPSNRMAGYLLQGDSGMDRRGLGLEHAVVEAGWRMDTTWGASIAVGQHGSDPAHVEAAWIQATSDAGPNAWRLALGRQRPELGAVLTTAGHMDGFAQVPLAKRVAVNDDWIDDGVQLGWRHQMTDVQWSVDAGLWQGKDFPGAGSGGTVPALHVGVANGDWSLDGFVAQFAPQGRGAAIASATGAHSHTAPTCDAALKQVVCFIGAANLTGASLRWNSHAWPVTASLAFWERQDVGTLYSANGTARYDGLNQGSWLDVVWSVHPRIALGARLESLQAGHTLAGNGASLVSTEAGFGAYRTANRHALMLGYLPDKRWEFRLESGEENVAGVHASYVAVRAVLRLEQVIPK